MCLTISELIDVIYGLLFMSCLYAPPHYWYLLFLEIEFTGFVFLTLDVFEMLMNVRSTQGVCISAKPGFGTFLLVNCYCSYAHRACFRMTVNFSMIIAFATFLLGSFLKPLDLCLGSNTPANLSFSPNRQWKLQLSSSRRRPFKVHASNRYSLSHFFVLPLLFGVFVCSCSVSLNLKVVNPLFNCHVSYWPTPLFCSHSPASMYCSYSEGGRANSAGFFVGGFVLGGIIVGTLGCVYAPQVRNTS